MKLRAFNIPIKIKLKDFSFKYRELYRSNYEVVFQTTPKSYLIVFAFGAYVCIDMRADLEEKMHETFNPGISTPIPEEYVISNDTINLNLIRITSLVLAQSIAITSAEELTEDMLEKTIVYSKALKRTGTFPTNRTELIKFIGFCTTTRQEILSNLYINGSIPEEAWEDHNLEKLFLKLKDQYDLESRFRGLNQSLDSIKSSIEIILDLINARRSFVGEWIIISLIAFEIIMSIADKIWR
jgi:required for meiotic nuclear division protein 1